MLNVYGLNLEKTAVLDNGFNRVEDMKMNAVSQYTFSLPADDPKAAKCLPYHYVRDGEDGQLFRILNPAKRQDAVGIKTYPCEHVIATLSDDVMFQQHIIGGAGYPTARVIEYILARQTTPHWRLGQCDFSFQYEYAWSSENLLTALYSLTTEFTVPFIWEFNTASYPWTVSLRRIDTSRDPQFYVRAGKNLLAFEAQGNEETVCTRLYGLGYGEGVNQLTISALNGGLPYLQAPQAYIDKYGLISRVYVDRRIESADILLARMQATLAELQDPAQTTTINAADLHELTGEEYDKAEIGRVMLFTDEGLKTYITGTRRNLDMPGDLELTLSTKPKDVASSIADMADRQRIEAVYSQGATQIYGHSIQANATPTKGAVLYFYVPREMVYINSIKAKVRIDRFRSYSKSTAAEAEQVSTSSSSPGSSVTSTAGGGGDKTSRAGGGTRESTEGGGGTSISSGGSSASTTNNYVNTVNGGTGYTGASRTTTSGYTEGHAHQYYAFASHNHDYAFNFTHTHGMGHTHTVPIPTHTHGFTSPSHTHTVSLDDHSHTVEIPSHTHTVRIPSHKHDIEQGIFEFGSPSTATLKVNSNIIATVSNNADIELTTYLQTGDTIPRGSWLKIELVPDDLAYITLDLFVQGFIQSKGGANY